MKTALTIAGTDPSGGAGIQADIKTMTANGVFATCAVTALVAQNTTGVKSIVECTPDFLAEELDCVFTDIFPDAVKTGMVSSIPLIRVIAAKLKEYGAKNLVVDPVMGDHGKPYRTYTPELCGRMRDLAAQADVITPNLTEAALLLEEDYADLPRDEEGLRAWLERLSLDGRRSVVLTGVSLRPGAIGAGCFDRATGRIRFAMARQEPAQFPGTGDLFASVVLGAMLRGEPLETAAQRAAEFVQRCAAHTLALGTPVLEG